MQRWKDEAYCQENTQIWSLPYSYVSFFVSEFKIADLGDATQGRRIG